MGRKRGCGNSLVQLFFLFGMLIIINATDAKAATGLECSVDTSSQCVGASIFDAGYGAVELCQVCYKCGGVSDGVCPESYSDGVEETNPKKIQLLMRVRRAGVFSGDLYSVAFKTGNEACSTIGGECDYVQRSVDNVLWTTEGGADRGCTRDVSIDNNNNAYYKAFCRDVPRKAGCEHCPDPDCTTTLSGYTTDETNGQPINRATIRVISENNPDLSIFPPGESVYGVYDMNAVLGEVNVTCEKDGYLPESKIAFLNPGRNIVDCVMSRAIGACTSQCYTPDLNERAACDAGCDGVNGCTFVSPEAKASCDSLFYGDKILISAEDYMSPVNNCKYINVTSRQCCRGDVSSELLKVVGNGGCNCEWDDEDCLPINLEGGSIISDATNASSLITRDHRKIINGLPVTIKIIVYNKGSPKIK